MSYVVGVYLCDRAYGGPEEGGWWYNTGELVRTVKVFRNEDKAIEFCQRMNRLLNVTINKGRREISSVLSEGRFYAEIHDDYAPRFYPETRPHYE